MTFISRQNIDFNRFEIVQTGIISGPEISVFSASAGTWTTKTDTVTIAHNLTYIPVAMAFIELGGVYFPLPTTATSGTQTNGSGWYINTWTVTTDATNLNVTVWASVFGTTDSVASLSVRYYLLKERASN